MRVLRWGARANHGNRSIRFDKFKIEWCEATRTFDLSPAAPVKDFSTDARHNYVFEFSIDDIVNVVKGIDGTLSEVDKASFIKGFEPIVGALNRLTNAASGMWFPKDDKVKSMTTDYDL